MLSVLANQIKSHRPKRTRGRVAPPYWKCEYKTILRVENFLFVPPFVTFYFWGTLISRKRFLSPNLLHCTPSGPRRDYRQYAVCPMINMLTTYARQLTTISVLYVTYDDVLLSTDDAKAVASAMVSSRLDYYNSVLSGTPLANLNKLQRVQNTAARIVTSTSKYEHYYTCTSWLTLATCCCSYWL